MKRVRHETKIAKEITQYLDLALPIGAVHFHVPNEGKRTIHEQAEFKACGGRAGIPDRWILWCGRSYCWEEKSKDGRLNDAQKEMFPLIEATGHPVPIVRSVSDAQKVLLQCGIPLRARIG